MDSVYIHAQDTIIYHIVIIYTYVYRYILWYTIYVYICTPRRGNPKPYYQIYTQTKFSVNKYYGMYILTIDNITYRYIYVILSSNINITISC